jgi:hypothetical protein
MAGRECTFLWFAAALRPLDFLRGLRIKNGVEILCIDRSFGICRQFSLLASFC